MKQLTRAKAIWAKCLDCGGCALEVTLCQVMDCPLWYYRMGGVADSDRNIARVRRKMAQGNDVYDEFREYYEGL